MYTILKSKIFYGLVLLVPAYTWSRFFKIWKRLRKKLKDRELFYSRHNCVVMYDNNRRVTGWPTTLKSIDKRFGVYDPLLYFIYTAQKSLDVAMMVISNTTIANALIKVHKRGIAIRIILDHDCSRNSSSKDLEKSGIPILYYVCPEQSIPSIMHYKFIVKDHSSNCGFVYIGSQNWSTVAFQGYYENTVFTTNRSVAKVIHKCFEDTWSYVDKLCKTDPYVKAKLKGVQ
ncbi:hypothetical protein ILUMI_12915 [Ignelater luminosus]|uniref:Mitochondrial cardiolipin hydrolase n=1 Tax=Ignelater luminosus TaxID=2038154 RepID=A0A8K0CTD6_IGNLU|nr:hypothetical protein ILUMI_12915 [Ignelater luminosus]